MPRYATRQEAPKRLTYDEPVGTNPTPPPQYEPKKKPTWEYEKLNDDGTSKSFLTTGFMPVLAPTSAVAPPPPPVAPPPLQVAPPPPPPPPAVATGTTTQVSATGQGVRTIFGL